MEKNPVVSLHLPLDDIMKINESLSVYPYRDVAPLLNNIANQVNPQLLAQPTVEAVPEQQAEEDPLAEVLTDVPAEVAA